MLGTCEFESVADRMALTYDRISEDWPTLNTSRLYEIQIGTETHGIVMCDSARDHRPKISGRN